MDLSLSAEQQSLSEVVGTLLRNAGRSGNIQSLQSSATGWRDDVWREFADMGILGLNISEEFGGSDAGPVEQHAVMVELGRALAPEPVLHGAWLPAHILQQAVDSSVKALYLAGIASGELRGAIAHEEKYDRWPGRAVSTSAKSEGESFVLTGAKFGVRRGDVADFFLVSARVEEVVNIFLVDSRADGLSIQSYRGTDGRHGCHLTLTDVRAVPVSVTDAGALLAQIEEREQVALCSEAVGVLEETLRSTVDYLNTREQFGVTLSTFQALAHRAADLYVRVELATSMVLYAVASLEAEDRSLDMPSRAKLIVSRTAREVGHEAIHMHGGIGVTSEHSIGHYAARLAAIENTLGGAHEHVQQLASSIDTHEKLLVG